MVIEFKVLLNPPPQGQNVYFGGSEVSGTLVVQTDEPEHHYKFIYIMLWGRAHVFWSETFIEHYPDGGARRQTRTYRSSEEYTIQNITVWNKENAIDHTLQPGQHDFRFQFSLPENVPPSFEGGDGWIRYGVKGMMIGTGSLKFEHTCHHPIYVAAIVDTSAPALQRPIRSEVRKTFCCLCCTSGPIIVTAEIPRQGFCIGDRIPVRAAVENGSGRRIMVTASLHRHSLFFAEGRHFQDSEQLVGGLSSGFIQPRTSYDWDPDPILIPSTVTTLQSPYCRIINILYCVKVTVVVSRRNASVELPITIGNECSLQ